MAPPPVAGGYNMGFRLEPLTADGDLNNALDFRGGRHKALKDPLYMMSCENRETGNRMVKEGQYEQAIAQYSELIVKTRTLEGEDDVDWDDDSRTEVCMLRATAYLNLSLCFLKTEQWTHASNTATRAMQGDKDPPDPKENVLPADKKAKALFRRATAQCEGFGNFDKALEDLRKAKELTPDDKGIEQMLRKCEIAVKKTDKAASKKMAGFLSKEVAEKGGLFDDSEERSKKAHEPQKQPTEPMKLKDGLFIMPPNAEEQEQKKVAPEYPACRKAVAAVDAEEKRKWTDGEFYTQEQFREKVVASKGEAEVGDADVETAWKEAEVAEAEEEIDWNEVSREINELREDNPDLYAEVRDKIQDALEKHAKGDA
eukprot:TRINITY_DN3142_c0_g1_i1.p2 TRINITY_DN3142_c0_g1~~TRINITY_DN3142_c0_g1_i1.p2  ORF type:complete len:371 (-),score=131.14 TRINITY_DN3142_c0_g1_i1:144-1256(-)